MDRPIRVTSVVTVAIVAAVGSGHLIPLRLRVGELYGGRTRELRLGYLRAAGGVSDARAAVALERTSGPVRGWGGLPTVLR